MGNTGETAVSGSSVRQVVTIDPSSTAVGWARFTGTGHKFTVVEAGVLRPERSGRGAIWRVQSLLKQFRNLVFEWASSIHYVIEVPSGKVGTGQRRGAASSLAIYGFAAGAIWGACVFFEDGVEAITERQWTRGMPKGKRTALLRLWCPFYDAQASIDPGGDMADAIGIGFYWERMQNINRMLREQGLKQRRKKHAAENQQPA